MDLEKIGKKIHDLRVAKGLTQREFADKLYVSHQAVSKWERGLSLPDITSLTEISKMFDITINELLLVDEYPSDEATAKLIKEITKPKKIKYIMFVIMILVFLTGLSSVIYIINKNSFEFKTISTTCNDFKITGSAAYNNDKSSIYISNIEYCGEEDNTVYQKIECTLLEDHDNKITKISNSDAENTTLEGFLKKLKINVTNYEYSCNKFNNSNLSLEIKAYTTKEKITSYTIPIKLDENCD